MNKNKNNTTAVNKTVISLMCFSDYYVAVAAQLVEQVSESHVNLLWRFLRGQELCGGGVDDRGRTCLVSAVLKAIHAVLRAGRMMTVID